MQLLLLYACVGYIIKDGMYCTGIKKGCMCIKNWDVRVSIGRACSNYFVSDPPLKIEKSPQRQPQQNMRSWGPTVHSQVTGYEKDERNQSQLPLPGLKYFPPSFLNLPPPPWERKGSAEERAIAPNAVTRLFPRLQVQKTKKITSNCDLISRNGKLCKKRETGLDNSNKDQKRAWF